MDADELTIVYSPRYDIHLLGIEKFHPFDTSKYSRAWKLLQRDFGNRMAAYRLVPETLPSRDNIKRVHFPQYLNNLRSAKELARIIEMPALAYLPPCLFRARLLEPMLLAVTGTLLGARQALAGKSAVNLSGGYNHAKPNLGGGFCIYSDIAIAVEALRASGELAPTDRILIVDLDAHQGNGWESVFYSDRRVIIFDMFNADIYPDDNWALDRADYTAALRSGCQDEQYLSTLRGKLSTLLQDLPPVRLAFYVAGTDIYREDRLGQMEISAEGVLQRDLSVLAALKEANLPWIMLTAGGYSTTSSELIARTVARLLTSKP